MVSAGEPTSSNGTDLRYIEGVTLLANPATNAESVTTRHSNHLSSGLQREFFNRIGRILSGGRRSRQHIYALQAVFIENRSPGGVAPARPCSLFETASPRLRMLEKKAEHLGTRIRADRICVTAFGVAAGPRVWRSVNDP
jgi:hypothetical protein